MVRIDEDVTMDNQQPSSFFINCNKLNKIECCSQTKMAVGDPNTNRR